MELLKNQEVDWCPDETGVNPVSSVIGRTCLQSILPFFASGMLLILDGKRELTEDIPYKIISLLQRKIKIEPASD
jgi:hypothetical protein